MARSSKTQNQSEKIASLFKYLGDPSRVTLLQKLQEEKVGIYVGDIASVLGVTHSAASHQLSSLEVRGIVESTREGQMVRYKLAKSSEAKEISALLRAASKL